MKFKLYLVNFFYIASSVLSTGLQKNQSRVDGGGGTLSSHTKQGAVAVVQGDSGKRHLAPGERNLGGGLAQLGTPEHAPSTQS